MLMVVEHPGWVSTSRFFLPGPRLACTIFTVCKQEENLYKGSVILTRAPLIAQGCGIGSSEHK